MVWVSTRRFFNFLTCWSRCHAANNADALRPAELWSSPWCVEWPRAISGKREREQWKKMKTEFIPCACRSCTSLYIIVHHCTSLYIIVHHCTSLYIIEHPCAPPRCFMFVLRVELKSETRASLIKPMWSKAGSSNRLGSVALHGLQPLCKGTASALMQNLCRNSRKIYCIYSIFTIPLAISSEKGDNGAFPKKMCLFLSGEIVMFWKPMVNPDSPLFMGEHHDFLSWVMITWFFRGAFGRSTYCLF